MSFVRRTFARLLPATLAPVAGAAASIAFFIVPAAAHAYDPAAEAQNYSKTQERQTIYNTPQYQLLLRQISNQNLSLIHI